MPLCLLSHLTIPVHILVSKIIPATWERKDDVFVSRQTYSTQALYIKLLKIKLFFYTEVSQLLSSGLLESCNMRERAMTSIQQPLCTDTVRWNSKRNGMGHFTTASFLLLPGSVLGTCMKTSIDSLWGRGIDLTNMQYYIPHTLGNSVGLLIGMH